MSVLKHPLTIHCLVTAVFWALALVQAMQGNWGNTFLILGLWTITAVLGWAVFAFVVIRLDNRLTHNV